MTRMIPTEHLKKARHCRGLGASGSCMGVTAPHDCMLHGEHHDRPDNRDEQAPDVEPIDARSAHELKEKTTDNGARGAEDDVQYHSLAALVHDLAGNEPGDQA